MACPKAPRVMQPKALIAQTLARASAVPAHWQKAGTQLALVWAVLVWVAPVPVDGAVPRPLRPRTPTMPPRVNSGKRNPQRVAVRCSDFMSEFWAGRSARAPDSP